MNNLQKTVERFQKMEIDRDFTRQYYRALMPLFKEYVRRMRYWYQVSGSNGLDWKGNIALVFDNTITVDEDLLQIARSKLYASEGMTVAERSLYWATLQDKYPGKYTVMNPYEPVLLLFELGSGFRKIQGVIELSTMQSTNIHQIMQEDLSKPFIEPTMEAVNAICGISDKE